MLARCPRENCDPQSEAIYGFGSRDHGVICKTCNRFSNLFASRISAENEWTAITNSEAV